MCQTDLYNIEFQSSHQRDVNDTHIVQLDDTRGDDTRENISN